MPKFPNPKSFISKAQWQRLIDRVMTRENLATGELNANLTKKMMQFEPPVSQEYGRFRDLQDMTLRDLKGSPVYKTHMMPYEKAREQVLADPDRFEPLQGGSSAKRVFKAEPGSEEELASGIAYERMHMKSIPKSIATTSRQLQKELPEAMSKEPSTISPLVTMMAEADDLWRHGLKGQANLGKTLWKQLYESSGGMKQHYDDAKSFFTSMYAKYKLDPNFSSKHKRIANYFDQLLSEPKTGSNLIDEASKLEVEGSRFPYWPGAKAVMPPMAAGGGANMMDLMEGGQ